jgi:predicted ribosome quality control (RQC) complex YloA/Tae2 family protein
MYLDAFTLAALADELLDTIVGGRVQDVLDVDETGIGLEIYGQHQRRYLYLSADPKTPRIHLVDDKLRRGLPKPTNVGLLLRRYLEGGTIAHVSQPVWERILYIDCDGPEGAVSVIIEPMERRSNLLLVQNQIVLDCMRRVKADENRVRVSLPGQSYAPPPPQTGKIDPAQVTMQALAAALAEEADPKRKAQQTLTARLLGFSPLLAREVVFRASGDSDQRTQVADPAALYEALQGVMQPLMQRHWQPGVAEADAGVAAFSVYPLTHIAGWHPVEGISSALARYYGAPVGADAYNAGKAPVREAIHDADARLSAKLASLQRSMTDDAEREVLRQSGELILAYQYSLTPGQTELRAAYEADRPELVIALNPEMTALENAQRYFERYNKAKRALDDVPDLIAGTQAELGYLRQLVVDLDLAASWPDIDEVQQALQAKGLWKGASKRVPGAQKSAPLRLVTRDGWVIWVGRNSRQNDQVTFDKGSANDLWLHARDVPGAHVIIKTDGRQPPETVTGLAASLAAYYSARRSESKVLVDVTLRLHVRKIKGAAAGMVTYRNEQTVLAAPRSAEDIQDI